MEVAIDRYQPIIRSLRNTFGERLRAIVLFGSQARDEAGPQSDHDLFVIVEGLPRDPLARNRAVRMPLLPILAQLPGSIAFVAKTPAEVQANLSPLILNICLEGICLYGCEYFEPYRRKALAALTASGMERRDVGGVFMWVFPHLPNHDWELTWDGFRARV